MNQHFKRGFEKGMFKGIVLAMVVATVYLSFSFVLMEIDPTKWSEVTRALFVFLSAAASGFTGLILWGGK
jgi:hypothetical protein